MIEVTEVNKGTPIVAPPPIISEPSYYLPKLTFGYNLRHPSQRKRERFKKRRIQKREKERKREYLRVEKARDNLVECVVCCPSWTCDCTSVRDIMMMVVISNIKRSSALVSISRRKLSALTTLPTQEEDAAAGALPSPRWQARCVLSETALLITRSAVWC